MNIEGVYAKIQPLHAKFGPLTRAVAARFRATCLQNTNIEGCYAHIEGSNA